MLTDLLEPGQVLAGAPTDTPTVVWAPESPTRTAVAHGRGRSSKHTYIFLQVHLGPRFDTAMTILAIL